MGVRVTATIRDRDRGYRALIRSVFRGTGSVVEVGVLGPKARAPSKRDSKRTVGEIAGYVEFGTKRIPKRPAIGGWFDKYRRENAEFARRLGRLRLAGKLDSIRSLHMMGVRAVGGIQKYISDGIAPPNADSTIARKGSSKPWIDTGQTRSSFSYRVVTGRVGA